MMRIITTRMISHKIDNLMTVSINKRGHTTEVTMPKLKDKYFIRLNKFRLMIKTGPRLECPYLNSLQR